MSLDEATNPSQYDPSQEVPDLLPFLRPGERINSVERCPTPTIETMPDYLEVLCALCDVDRPEDIGMNGPAIAARSLHRVRGQGLYECPFARDALIAALNVFPQFPRLLRSTLIFCAERIGMIAHRYRSEQYGRTFHEARDPNDPIARKITHDQRWEFPYYGAVDSTPLFVIALHAYVKYAKDGQSFLTNTHYIGRDEQQHTMLEALKLSMSWIISRVNKNDESFLEYYPGFETDHVNQVMEDSWDSHFHADGTLANTKQGVCSTEVQGYAYDALMMAAELVPDECLRKAQYWRLLAGKLRDSVRKHLIVEDERGLYLAVGSDRGDKDGRIRVMKVRKAIPYFLLNSRILKHAEDRQTVERLLDEIFSEELLGHAGLRSLAYSEPRFMPTAYHNGNVWPMQTFGVAEGLRNHGFDLLAEKLEMRVRNLCEKTKMYPEYVSGTRERVIKLNERIVKTEDTKDGRFNQREQPPQQIQLWTVSAYAAIQFRQRNGPTAHGPTPIEEKFLSSM